MTEGKTHKPRSDFRGRKHYKAVAALAEEQVWSLREVAGRDFTLVGPGNRTVWNVSLDRYGYLKSAWNQETVITASARTATSSQLLDEFLRTAPEQDPKR